MKKLLQQSVFLIACSLTTFAQKEAPELWGHRVHDDAHVLQQSTIDQLEKLLEQHEDSTSNQIAVLIINSLEGEVIEDYSMRVVEKWKLGTAKNDNGILLLVAVDDHEMRIEVGMGLEGVLTDATCSQIIRNEIAPAFRRDDYDEGVMAGIDAILKTIGGEYVSEGEDGVANDYGEMGIAERIWVGLFVFGILGLFTFVALVLEGCAGWGVYAFLIPFYAAFPHMVLGGIGAVILLAVYVIGMPIAKVMLGRNPKWKEKMKKFRSSGGSGGGWSSGGWSSGGGWGGGGGGFSGGGGSFGGGGSSGRW